MSESNTGSKRNFTLQQKETLEESVTQMSSRWFLVRDFLKGCGKLNLLTFTLGYGEDFIYYYIYIHLQTSRII